MPNKKYIAFDIETAKDLPDHVDDLKAYRPLGICCAVTLVQDEDDAQHFFSTDAGGVISAQMSKSDLQSLVGFLLDRVASGYTIVTWNGLGFDFDVLAEESGLVAECSTLAAAHIDMMFHVFCLKGFPVSLSSAAEAIGVQGKTPGIEGAVAPRLWAQGKTNEVLAYSTNDCRMTLDVAIKTEQRGQFSWITRRGKPSSCELIRGQWCTVDQALRLPNPDTSWMDDPWPRSRFTSWMS